MKDHIIESLAEAIDLVNVECLTESYCTLQYFPMRGEWACFLK